MGCSDSIKVEQDKKYSFTDLTHGTMSYLCTRAIDALDNSSEWLVSTASETDTVAPGNVINLTPVGGSQLSTTTVNLDWDDVSDASSYIAKYCSDSSCSNDCADIQTPSLSSATLTVAEGPWYLCTAAVDLASNQSASWTISQVIIDAAIPPNLDAFTAAVLYSQKTGAETIVDAGDGGDDTDGDGDTITYECWFDQTQDDSVTESAGTQCSTANLTGISFTSGTGVLSWDPTDAQTGSYEF